MKKQNSAPASHARCNGAQKVTIEIPSSKYEVFTAAATEITRRSNLPVTPESVMALLLEGECDAEDIANLYCWNVLHWPLEWIDKPKR